MIFFHGKIYTVDSVFSTAEAMAVDSGKIMALGTDAEIGKNFDAGDNVTDLGGKPVFPGFIDAHAHFVSYGNSLFTASLFGSGSFDEVVRRVRDFAADHPGLPWIMGRGWDQNKFPDNKFPDNTLLNQAFPGIPVVLTRVDGHAMSPMRRRWNWRVFIPVRRFRVA